MDQETSYHHGDLRRALLAAAHETIRTRGAARLTLREVARAANVSHAAPYHHFKNKDALLAAVAEQGFRALRQAVEARSAAAARPALALQEAAVAYVLFAVEHPDLFRVMFGPQLADKSAYPSLQAEAAAAYQAVEEQLARCGLPGEGSSDRAGHLALASWAVMHGLAMLLIDRQVGEVNATAAEDLAKHVTDIFWLGLSGYHAAPDSGSTG